MTLWKFASATGFSRQQWHARASLQRDKADLEALRAKVAARQAELAVERLAQNEHEHQLIALDNSLMQRQRKLNEDEAEIARRDADSRSVAQQAVSELAVAQGERAEVEAREVAARQHEDSVALREDYLIEAARKLADRRQ
jgi:hypothetical protein